MSYTGPNSAFDAAKMPAAFKHGSTIANRTAPALPHPPRVVSGRTKSQRGTAPTTGERIVSGRTKALRGLTPPPGSNSGSGGGGGGDTTDTTTPPATGGKSGKTLAARAQALFIQNIVHYLTIAAVIVGPIYLIRRFHLLSGGEGGGGRRGGGGGGGHHHHTAPPKGGA